MIELPMIFVAGILGTAHCVGMCGPFALAIGTRAGNWPTALARQAAYTAGRVFTYGTLGTMAGFCGWRLTSAWPSVVQLPALLAIVAGLMLFFQGAKARGWFPRGALHGNRAPCLAAGFFGHFLHRPGGGAVFLAGIFTGFLPCGLLYGMLALAISTHSPAWGGLTMVVFGLGTAPAMILAGLSGKLLGLATRQRLLAAAAWCLMLSGAISVARGVSFLSSSCSSTSGCPVCRH